MDRSVCLVFCTLLSALAYGAESATPPVTAPAPRRTGILRVDGRLAEFEEMGDIQPRAVWTNWYFAFRN